MASTPIIWPAGLPQTVLVGATEAAPSQTIRTQMDAGPEKVRRRFTAAPRQVSTRLVLKESAANLLVDFYDLTLKGGSLEFEWKRPLDDSTVRLRFLERPVLRLLAGGVSPPPEEPVWETEVRLEILPP